jgi:hypothetical protein
MPTIDSEAYVETAVALDSGRLNPADLDGENLGAIRKMGSDADRLLETLNDPDAVRRDGRAEIVAIQRVMRSFGLIEGRTTSDFNLGDHVVSTKVKDKAGVVHGCVHRADLLKVRWNGPRDIVEVVSPGEVLRRGPREKFSSEQGTVSSDGVVTLGEHRYVPENAVLAEALAEGDAKVARSQNGAYVLFETSDGVCCCSKLKEVEEEETPRAKVSAAYVQRKGDDGDEQMSENALPYLIEAVLECEGDPSDSVRLSRIIRESAAASGSSNWTALMEQSMVAFATGYGRPADVKDVDGAVTKAAERAKRPPRIPFNRAIPSKMKSVTDMKLTNGEQVDVAKLDLLISSVERAMNACKLVIASGGTQASRTFARALFSLFRDVVTMDEEPHIPVKTMRDFKFENHIVLEGRDDNNNQLRPGIRMNFKIANPLTVGMGDSGNEEASKEIGKEVHGMLVRYRNALMKLRSNPGSTQLVRMAARILTDLLSFLSGKSNQPWGIVGVMSGTGEPKGLTEGRSEDYDTETFDAIVKGLAKAGIKDVEHRLFDHYQGVYLKVPGAGNWFAVDGWHKGKRTDAGVEHKWRSAKLYDDEGHEVSSTKGDYFSRPSDSVVGHKLVLVDGNGKTTEIDDPKVSDLPGDGEVSPKTFMYEKGTSVQSIVFQREEGDETVATVTVSEDRKKVDVDELVDAIKSASAR